MWGGVRHEFAVSIMSNLEQVNYFKETLKMQLSISKSWTQHLMLCLAFLKWEAEISDLYTSFLTK